VPDIESDSGYESLTLSLSSASTLVENRTDFRGVVGRVPSLPLPDDAPDLIRGDMGVER